MAAEVFFSIIIPTFNAAGTLKRCLDSIISQTYPNLEIYFIDGGSADDTLRIIKDYKETYPFISYRSDKDNGIYDAMNKGIQLAKGNWLYFLGADDALYNKEVLQAVANKIRTGNMEVVYGSVIMRGENKWNLNNVVFDGEYTFEKFIDRNICQQAIFYSRSIIEKIGNFNLKYCTNADFDLNLRCYAQTEFTYIDLIIADFYVGGQSSNVEDYPFIKDRGALLLQYFGKRIFTKRFINARLYIRQAALADYAALTFFSRAYCLAAYLKLKAQAMLSAKNV